MLRGYLCAVCASWFVSVGFLCFGALGFGIFVSGFYVFNSFRLFWFLGYMDLDSAD